MNDIKKSLPEPCLLQMNFQLCPCKDHLSPEGVCFEPSPDRGEGYYWYYEQEGLFAVSIMDLSLKEDQTMAYQQQDFISVNYYDTISAEELMPYKRVLAHRIRGHVSNSEFFRARYHHTVPIRGMELMLMPGYYHDYLEKKYPGEFHDYKEAFLSIDGSSDFPELVLVFRQIRAFQGTGLSARLFYESKVAEAVSLIIEKTKKQKRPVSDGKIAEEDLLHLDNAKGYIEDHFAFDIKAEQLAKIACMGQTKMRSAFKRQYGCTITEFIQNKRIAHAEYMLMKTDLTVGQIAQAVGYHHAGHFATLFQKNTGLFPEEYRKLSFSNSQDEKSDI